MASSQPACLYQETRLNLDSAETDSVVDVQIPSQSSFSSRLSPKRRRIDRPPIVYDEDTFSKFHLASESSIHFRPKPKDKKKDSPLRGILWRVLNERRLLELQAVDLYHESTEKQEPFLTLRLSFSEAIRPGGIAFAEKEEENGSNALVVFALTTSGELFTITLRREHFSKRDLLQDEASVRSKSWCSSCTPSSLSYRTPFRLHAKDDRDLWVSCGDGSLVRLTRREGDDGSNWRDSAYTEGGWSGSMRGLLSWKSQKSVRYNGADILANTATSIATSPDERHVWTVGLDHTLRAWNIEKGGVVFQQDLAGDSDRDLQRPPDFVLQPTLSQRIQVLPGKHDAEYYVMTFSPKSTSFKTWLIRDVEAPEHGWSDARADIDLVTPVGEFDRNTAWTMESFHFDAPKHRNERWRLWILVRMGSQSHAYTTTFDLHESKTSVFEKSWRDNWTGVNHGLVSTIALRTNLLNPSELHTSTTKSDARGPGELWIDFLFYPGTFTPSTIETALNVYSRSLGCSTKSSAVSSHALDERPLKNRVADVVGRSVILGPASDDGLHYARFEQAIAAQWQIFYGVVKDLHLRREEVMALVIDTEEQLPWVVAADSVSPMRACSEVEVLWHNREIFAIPESLRTGSPMFEVLKTKENPATYGQLFHALSVLRTSLSPSFVHSFSSLLKMKTSQDAENDEQTLLAMYAESGFEGQVSDAGYDKLTDALDLLGGFGELDDEVLLGALELMTEAQHGSVHKQHTLARYGAKTLIRGAQDTLELSSNIVLDLLLLVTFIGGELEEGDLAENFSAARIFNTLFVKAKELQLLSWLASSTPSGTGLSSKSTTKMFASEVSGTTVGLRPQLTLLENLYLGDWSSMKIRAGRQPEVITYWCRAWISHLTMSGDLHGVASGILGVLIMNSQANLALDILPFVFEEPWPLYLTGRLFLMVNLLDQAMVSFKAAAEGLGAGKFVVEKLPAVALLDFEEKECLNNGMAKYYQHIVSLFEKVKAYSYASDVAQMALEIEEQGLEEDKRLRTDLLSRLFTSAHKTSRFELAYSALSKHNDLALRDSSLRTLVTTLVSTPDLPTLLALPYASDLSAVADATISELAAKQTASSAAGSPAPSYHKILYAFRLRLDDLRGAASCLWERLQLLRQSQGAGFRGEDVDEEIAECYLTLINVLSLVRSDQAWILTRPPPVQGETQKRVVITLENVRQAWQEELDRVADVAAGRFAIGLDWDEEVNGARNSMPGSFGGAEAMEVDVAG